MIDSEEKVRSTGGPPWWAVVLVVVLMLAAICVRYAAQTIEQTYLTQPTATHQQENP